MALIETKARPRWTHEPQVSMQEGAQIVALLKDRKPPAGEPVFLISQDGPELYISTATPSAAYLAYIKNQSSSLHGENFLQIHKYGPYDIREDMKMHAFSCLALSIVLKATS
ncbi:uncharacterized protein N7515_009898 [Penicillium bovifimosum]|uniref:Uncharacterized protein n=1 Tax=Penicillium bovifimosum TaxID=126998 RepID=A0A9W9GHF8_9EURO|nr:uncharacterized protein N7515_009898 [Penicillium bovifimosum]KAJ5120510.1 hypothetical protein N7515_009898 [Penicillium bovifimosum]